MRTSKTSLRTVIVFEVGPLALSEMVNRERFIGR